MTDVTTPADARAARRDSARDGATTAPVAAVDFATTATDLDALRGPGRAPTGETRRVEMWRGGGGRTYLYPPLSSGGASLVRPWLRFHIPLIEPDRRIYRIRLSDKTSRLHPRRATTKPGQAYEPKVLVKVREWISSALASPDLVLEAQPPAQPHSRVVVEHPIRFAGGSNAKVIGPSAERLVQLIHQPCGLLPSRRSDGQRVDSFDHALDALL